MDVNQGDGYAPVDGFPTSNSTGTTHSAVVTPTRPTPIPEQFSKSTTEIKKIFYHQLLARNFSKLCTCEECMPHFYFKYPYSCPMLPHDKRDIVILPKKRPQLLVFSTIRPYEALQIANSAIQYFSRPENDMDLQQHEALEDIRKVINAGLMQKLGSPYAQLAYPADDMRALCRRLVSIFFFGAAIPIQFVWDFDVCQKNDWLGFTETGFHNGDEFECITMHPTKVTIEVEMSRNREESLALQRLSTLMHELIHAVLRKLACSDCVIRIDNLSAHGRAFQRLAMAIEKESPRLLGLDLDLGRMDGVLNDMKDVETGFNHPSVHDLEVYGFVESLEERLGLLNGSWAG
jgi:hypothetical protein